MLKFIRGKGQQPTAERQRQQRELFAFRNTLHHGFPNKPSALAWDPTLRLMAIGTSSGAIKVVGNPGVEFYGQHQSNESPVTNIVFLPSQGRLVTLCDDNSLHLWEVNESSLEEVKSQALEGKLKKISAICLESSAKNLLLGTEGGNIYLLSLETFETAEPVIYQDVVLQKIAEDFKINPGAVEAIAEQPENPDNILIGYNRGLMVLWNRETSSVEQTFVSSQDLESICWHETGTKFASSHNDGSYAIFNVPKGPDPPKDPISPHGPFPCKAMTKLLWRKAEGEDMVIFSGGLQRATHSDRYCITVSQGEKIVVFDFTSKIVDFFTVSPREDATGPEALIVLAEEEIVAIDLQGDDWLQINLPYLVSVHASSVTCSQYVSDVSPELWAKIEACGQKQMEGQFSSKTWPIDGGVVTNEKVEARDLLLTGHEDGSVRFWAAGGVALRPLYKLTTSNFFHSDDIALDNHADDDEDNGWPPFKKVGFFDPYSDDPRLAVKKLSLCPVSGVLVVAGTAGHIIIAELKQEAKEEEIPVTVMNIVSDRDGFVWKGHSHLAAHENKVKIPAGFQPTAVMQLHPPVAVTALMLHSDWGLIVAGTAHGLALFDYIRSKPVITKCTLNPNDLSGAGEQAISRRKSFKKSLRESFRRLRKGRSTRHGEKRGGATSGVTSPTSPAGPDRRKEGATDATTGTLEPKPIERQVEARPVDDGQGSMVRCVYLARTFIISVQNTTPTMWAGTNNGTVYVFTLSIPQGAKRKDDGVQCQLGKEIQLKHRAPVIGISIVDSAGVPLPEPLQKGPDPVGPHRVIISSEEQFKMFTLPSLKPLCKLKLTAHEGSRVRRTAMALFKSVSSANPQHSEWCLVCLTNLGDCIVLSTPDLRRQLNAAVIRREDVHGISSLCFTKHGEALYLHSSSELQRVSLSAQHITQAHCHLELPPGVRPGREVEAEAEEEEEEEEEAEEGSEEESPKEGEVEAETTEVEVVVKQDSEVKVESSPDKKEEKKISGPPSPAPRSITTPTPLVNGDAESACKKEVSSNSNDEPKENGVSSEEERLEISMGDITIDSVKDHLINCSTLEESRVTSEKMEVKNSTTLSESVIIKSTTTIINSEESTNNASPTVVESNFAEPFAAFERYAHKINSQKAPLAPVEDLEMDMTT
ncbi:lethal(2) giant larvae protein homolog 1 isoform X2 [Thrips palmi]|nr:lethal(2) giant larvae protein homolog 1 isoform X2 [Thrips palmi]XP_034242861.1 lethal(2) giant larvae protein homolog 1 isoform X2 [Thrips palmi]XP_034242862.1 lethal(2) giant larvae protein homolog 1 isoform X2 [Thrips palmi]